MSFGKTIPTLRPFDEAKGGEFYVDFLAFTIEVFAADPFGNKLTFTTRP